MKFNVYFTVRGPTRTLEMPNVFSVEADNLAALLIRLAASIPDRSAFGIEFVGLRVEPAVEDGACKESCPALTHEFDSSLTCNYCGVAAERVKGIAEKAPCPARR
jgi:hypothetical protein